MSHSLFIHDAELAMRNGRRQGTATEQIKAFYEHYERIYLDNRLMDQYERAKAEGAMEALDKLLIELIKGE